MNIAILGVTGHIAKAVMFALGGENSYLLFSRNPGSAEKHVRKYFDYKNMKFFGYDAFPTQEYDTVINCISAHDEVAVYNTYSETEICENMIFAYLQDGRHSGVRYVNFSSGAAYGQDFSEPAGEASVSRINLNNIGAGEHYSVIKLYSEAKHRAFAHLNIVDLRIFSFFSRFIDLSRKYLLTDLISCVREKREFITDNTDIKRDYIHIDDFRDLLQNILRRDLINTSVDLRSAKPVGKFEIINYFREHYDLKVIIDDSAKVSAFTGNKYNYFSERENHFGIKPRYSSLEAISLESSKLLSDSADN